MPSLVTERIESVKAGIFGAATFAVAELVFLLAQGLVLELLPELNHNAALFFGDLGEIELALELGITLGIGAVSGFLFGVTYRYIIRSDRNSHLNDGAVLAFGLVRGLALGEKDIVVSELLSLGSFVLQSIFCFAIARLILDLAIARKLIKPFV
ncbi:MAG: hypothetical protein RLZZ04_1206 [Cyanobacteriota bacterium]